MSVFTAKHYEEVAKVLRVEYTHQFVTYGGEAVAVERLTEALADLFEHDNPRFKRDMFYRGALGRPTLRPSFHVETGREEQGNE